MTTPTIYRPNSRSPWPLPHRVKKRVHAVFLEQAGARWTPGCPTSRRRLTGSNRFVDAEPTPDRILGRDSSASEDGHRETLGPRWPHRSIGAPRGQQKYPIQTTLRVCRALSVSQTCNGSAVRVCVCVWWHLCCPALCSTPNWHHPPPPSPLTLSPHLPILKANGSSRKGAALEAKGATFCTCLDYIRDQRCLAICHWHKFGLSTSDR